MAKALETGVAIAVLAAGQCNAFVAFVAVISKLAQTFVRAIAVALYGVAARSAFGHVAQIARPAGQALHLAVIVAHVMGMLVLGRGQLTRLQCDRVFLLLNYC